MLRALILKELRLHRTTLIAAAVLALLLEVALPCASVYYNRSQNFDPNGLRSQAMFTLYSTSSVALAVTCLFASIFAASQTIERRERWAEFAAMLPASRGRRAAVALTVAASLTIALSTFHTLIMLYASRSLPLPLARLAREHQQATEFFFSVTTMTIAVFSLTWLGAAFMRSAALLVSIVTGGVVLGLIATITLAEAMQSRAMIRRIDADVYGPGYLIAVAILGVLAIVGGTLVRTRRVEP